MRPVYWVALAVLGACASPSAVDCGDYVCPAENTCGPGGTCISPAQLSACANAADDASCNVDGIGAGVCRDGVCVFGVCGNGVIELDEVCDDGNLVNGDGCASTCRSDETCGNGVFENQEECDCGTAEHPGGVTCNGTFNGGAVCSETCKRRFCGNGTRELDEQCDDGNAISGDGCSFGCSLEDCANGILDSAAGEECDDGNTRNRDGCSADCRAERLDWRHVTFGQSPSARFTAAMAYDAARERTVLFGGSDTGDYSTWEHDGTTWRQVAQTGPTPNTTYRMAYDAERARIVLFGLVGSVQPVAETWTFDGVSWTKLSPTVSPPPRGAHHMAYDARRKRIILFGGIIGSTPLGDTWAFDGTTWTQLFPATSPSPRFSGGMEYDPKRDRVVLFGGGGLLSSTDETWEFDGTTWVHRDALTTKPGARFNARLAYDTARSRMVMFGGSNGSTDVFEYDGVSTWVVRTIANPPAGRTGHSAVYDQARKQYLVFGGTTSPGGVALGDTYVFNGTTWSPSITMAPQARWASAMTYDIAAGRVVLFGGAITDDAETSIGDTWRLEDTRWTPILGGSPPPARHAHAMTYDRARRRVVLFGGTTRTSDPMYVPFGDTWELDGTTWTSRATTGPDARLSAALAYDTARSRVVLHGGFDSEESRFGDTWELGAGNWTEVAPTTSPAARAGHAMTYDEELGRCVMFGGDTGIGFDNATWHFDGMTWTSTVSGPSSRTHARLVYDVARGRVVLFGGQSIRETWEREGTTWEQMTPTTSPPQLHSPAMAYDIGNSRTVLFGGLNGLASVRPETWFYEHVLRVAPEACRSGVDYDHDGTTGCLDDECWTVCTPLCPPGTASCGTELSCGDGECSGNENCRVCPSDCTVGASACPILCGDYFCDATESTATCPGDCP